MPTEKPKYPLGVHHPDEISSSSGVALGEVTLENVLSGSIKTSDLAISGKTLLLQAGIALAAGNRQLAENLSRAAELVEVPIEQMLRIYDALRPGRSTHEELDVLANEIEGRYHARLTATMIREARDAYARSGLLRGDSNPR